MMSASISAPEHPSSAEETSCSSPHLVPEAAKRDDDCESLILIRDQRF
jgi:hypothetical protein